MGSETLNSVKALLSTSLTLLIEYDKLYSSDFATCVNEQLSSQYQASKRSWRRGLE
jgi:hypothetical protein